MSWVKGSSKKGLTERDMQIRQDAAFWYWQYASEAYWNLNMETNGEY